MIKIVGLEVIDLLPFGEGILFVIRESGRDGQKKIMYYSYDIRLQTIASVTKNAYLMNKFGSAFMKITSHMEDTVSCTGRKFPDGRQFVIYSTGEIGIFSEKGELLQTGDIFYKNKPVRDAASDGDGIWCVSPEENRLIRYSPDKNRITMCIGDASCFDRPSAVAVYDGKLYVSCRGSRSVQVLDKTDYSVAAHLKFSEPVLKYLRIGQNEVVVLQSGVYLL